MWILRTVSKGKKNVRNQCLGISQRNPPPFTGSVYHTFVSFLSVFGIRLPMHASLLHESQKPPGSSRRCVDRTPLLYARAVKHLHRTTRRSMVQEDTGKELP